jgi:AmmeMemoRadiSam system protein B
MMILREPYLPDGWYFRNREAIGDFLRPFTGKAKTEGAAAVIAPHAGWYFSGSTAALAVSFLDRDAETVAIIGGHLPRGAPFLFAPEEGVKTPLGVMEIDRELAEDLKGELSGRPDKYQDNTVEVLLPMVHWFFPRARLLWLRFPAEASSFKAGKLLAERAGALGRRLAVVGSTDLTHYGRNYGFSPCGGGREALEWVKKVNDAAFIRAVLSGDPAEVLRRAEEDYSACSAGAVLGALGFAGPSGPPKAELLAYATSADVMEEKFPDSFVGYAALKLCRQRGSQNLPDFEKAPAN